MSLSFSRWRGRNPGLSRQSQRRRAGQNRRTLSLETMETRTLLSAGTITSLVNTVPNGSGTMMLETNGDVIMVDGGDNTSNEYYVLTPDAQGNYVDGKWSQAAPSDFQRLFNGSVILPTGQMMVLGGEYSGSNNASTYANEGEIYNPSTNTWTNIATFPQSQFGDDMLVNLPGTNGTVLAGYLGGPQTYLYNSNTNTWTQTGTKLFDDQSDEEGFVELPNGDFLDYDIFSSINNNVGQAQYYVPSTGQWIATQNLPNGLQLSSVASGYEEGAGMLLPNGTVLQIGGNGNSAYYNPSTNAWTAGATIPGGLVEDDAPSALADNGIVITSADTVGYNGPTHWFELNTTTNTYTDISAEFPSGYLDGPAFLGRTLDLPNGQILMNNGGNQLLLYTPSSPALASNIPTISSVVKNPTGVGFTLTGTDINGNSDGAYYGDDANMATNYPIVSLTSSTGQVAYATTSGFSYQVEQGSKPLTTNFTPPAGLATGTYSVRVIANGAASSPFSLNLTGPTITAPASATPNPVFGKTTQLSVSATDAGGASNLTYTWSTTSLPAGVPTPTFSINGSNAAQNDKATFFAEGVYTFKVTATNPTGISATSTVTVNVDPTLASFGLAPTKVQLSAGQTEQFVASGLDQFGNIITTSTAFTWSVTAGGGTVTQTGLYTAPATGTIATVKVSTGSLSLTSSVYVLSNPWQQTDIGSPTIGGDAADNGAGLFTLLGAGTGISGTADQLQYSYLTVTGNSTIQGQVATVQNTNAAAEAGLMFRNDASAGSPNVTVAITPNNGLVFSYRTVENGATTSITIPRVTAGYYLKLVRVGNIFTASYSANGTTWTQAGSVSDALSGTDDAGLTVSSTNASSLNTSTFNHVLADSTPTIVTSATANPNPVTTTKTTLSVLGGDSAGESALTYTWAVTSSPAGAVTPTFATNGTNASKSDVATFFKAGTYSFKVTLANALGYSTTSSVTVSVVATQASVKLTPLTATVTEGQTQQFTAGVYDQFGLLFGTQPRFTYSIIAGGAGGKVSSTGLYTAPTTKTGIDYINVTGAGSAAVAEVSVTSGVGMAPKAALKVVSAPLATIGTFVVGWGSDSAPLVTAADGLRLLPVGRKTDLPWGDIQMLAINLSKAEPLVASDVKVTGQSVANYGPVTVTPISATTYVITLAKPIAAADRVTVTIASSTIATYTRRLDVLPGDVNDDGIVNAADATVASSYLLSLYLPADIYGAGVVSSTSVKAIKLLNGTTLPLLS